MGHSHGQELREKRQKVLSLPDHIPVARETLINLAHRVVPETIKSRIRRYMKRDVRYTPDEPYQVHIGDFFNALFNIHNEGDYWTIAYNNDEKRFLIKVLDSILTLKEKKENITFFDIGADQGLFSIFAGKAGAKVIAFDPNPLSEKSFKENVVLNPDTINNISHHQVGLGARRSTLSLSTDHTGRRASSFAQVSGALKDSVKVTVVPLDQFVLDDKSAPMPDVVKIDVEGYEGEVLEGMQRILTSKDKPRHLFIEIHAGYLPKFGTNYKAIERTIKDFGYKLISFSRRGSDFHCHFIMNENK